MVNEVETLLASFFENGHVNDEWRKEEPKRVNAYIARLKRFIDNLNCQIKLDRSSILT